MAFTTDEEQDILAVLTGNRDQVIDTGVIRYFGANGETVRVTLTPAEVIPIVAANWTNLTLTLTLTNAFIYYRFLSGDKIQITAGTGVTPGEYTIASKTDQSNIVLTASITGGADVSDNTVAGSIENGRSSYTRS